MRLLSALACSRVLTAQISSNRQNPEMWTLEVDISGDVFFEDKAVDLLTKGLLMSACNSFHLITPVIAVSLFGARIGNGI